MNKFGKSILYKLLSIASISTVIVMAAGIFNLYGTYGLLNEFKYISEEQFQTELDVSNLTTDFKKQVQEWKNVLIRGADKKQFDKYWSKFEALETKVQTDSKALMSVIDNPEIVKHIESFINSHKHLGVEYRKGLKAFIDSGYVTQVGDHAVKGIDRAPTEHLEKILAMVEVDVATIKKETYDTAFLNIWISGGLMLAGLGLALISFVFLANKLFVKPSKQLSEDLAKIADGDFTCKIHIHSEDEIGNVAKSASLLSSSLGNMVNDIMSVVNQLGSSASSLSSVALETKQGVQRQHSETDQIATAINEMTATVQEVSNHATQAAGAAAEADDQAQKGKNVVAGAVDAISRLAQEVEQSSEVIRELERNSQEIGSVLDVIRGIAEQTNLLALNAAIEAARAGEQGRGFAVVADEVRTLAQRTQESTQEIQTMIERLQAGANNAVGVMASSRERAHETVGQAEQAGESLNAIVAAIGMINDMNTQIASAAEEQASVAGEINRNVISISDISDKSAVNMEKTTKESDNVAMLSGNLQSLIAKFKV